MKQYITHSENETRQLAKKLANKLAHGVLALNGELGAGKTTFVQGFARGLGIKEKIISPTFVLIRQHKIPNSKLTLFHIDLYRLEGEKDFKELGLEQITSDPKNIVVIEWAKKLNRLLPKNTIHITFKQIDHNKREISIAMLK